MASDGFMGAEVIPFRIFQQSLYAFHPTNGMRHHADMDIVRNNIQFLMDRGNLNQTKLALLSGVGQSWISRYLKGPIEKSNPEFIAKIAESLGVTPAQLMWEDLTVPGALDQSQLSGPEQVIMAAAKELERYLAELSPVPLPASGYKDRIYVASLVANEVGPDAILSGDRLIEAAKLFAARLRQAR